MNTLPSDPNDLRALIEQSDAVVADAIRIRQAAATALDATSGIAQVDLPMPDVAELLSIAEPMRCVFEPGGTFALVDGQLADLLGYDPDEMHGRMLSEFVAADDDPFVKRAHLSVLEVGYCQFLVRMATSTGTLRWVSIVARTLTDHADPTAVGAIDAVFNDVHPSMEAPLLPGGGA